MFGLALPATMPLWVGILLVVIAYQLVAWPIKAVRYSCYYPRPPFGYGGPWGGLFGRLYGLAPGQEIGHLGLADEVGAKKVD